VPQLIKGAVADGTFSSLPGKLQIHPERLDGWLVESFEIEPQPPFKAAERRYPDGMRLLIDIDQKKIGDAERYWQLSIGFMVDHCHAWARTVGWDYKIDITASRMKLGPVHCNRLLSPNRSQAYDVIVFTAERGSFIGSEGLKVAAERFIESQPQNTFIWSPFGNKYVEAQIAFGAGIDPFAVGQLVVRRYAPSSTFLHASFGKERKYDSYLLMFANPKTLVVLQTFYSPRMKTEDLWPALEAVLRSIR
jgi:hypothetical protein